MKYISYPCYYQEYLFHLMSEEYAERHIILARPKVQTNHYCGITSNFENGRDERYY